METNTLVTHKKMQSLGIGCIAKELKTTYKVNFGLENTMTCKKNMVVPVDTSACKTISYNEFSKRILNDKSELNNCIVGNELLEYVGIGWHTLRVVSQTDLLQYPRVV